MSKLKNNLVKIQTQNANEIFCTQAHLAMYCTSQKINGNSQPSTVDSTFISQQKILRIKIYIHVLEMFFFIIAEQEGNILFLKLKTFGSGSEDYGYLHCRLEPQRAIDGDCDFPIISPF